MKINIAIDGPVSSGKTSLGQALAKKINYQFLDTGLFYRYFAKICSENDLSYQKKEKVIAFCLQEKEKITKNPFQFVQMLENQRNILTQPKISKLASQFSPIPELRQIIYELVKILVKDKGFVVVGRDMTFKVLPEAELKIFLTAKIEKRAERRYWQLRKDGKDSTLEEVKKDLIERDQRDEMNILQAKKAELKIDTSDLTFKKSIEKLYELFIKKFF